jgi:hypothetical protein
VIDGVLMTKYARKGPDELGIWPVRNAPLSSAETAAH